MKKIILLFATLLIGCAGASQENNETVKDSVASKSKLTAAIDVVYPYLWRGFLYYGNKVAFQPYVKYAFTDKLSFGLWATTNFSNANDAYNEFDWSISYQITPVVNITLADYYWPATSQNLDWKKSNYLDYSEGSSQSLELSVLFDFSEKGLPISFQWNTFIGGDDYNYDDEENPTTRAFSSYAQVDYTHTLKKSDLELQCFLGAVVINGGYYIYEIAKTPNFSFTNFGVGATKKIKIYKNYSIPLFVKYIHNNYGVQEFDNDGNLTKTIKNFFSCGLTFNLL
jgi:hypothetical protein